MVTMQSADFLKSVQASEFKWEHVPPFICNSTADAALQFICRFGGQDRKLFEFGTWIGRSALGFSQNYGKVVTMDYYDGSDISYSYNGYRSGQLVEQARNVVRIQADSTTFDFVPYGCYFDVVYVDGNHSYNGCSIDLKSATWIVKPDGMIFVDDYCNPEMGVQRAVDDFPRSCTKILLEDLKLVVIRL